MAGDRRALCLVAGAILLCSCFARVLCGDEQEQQQEIQRLRSKVASLEDEVGWRKEETSQLESVVRERTAQIAALVGGLEAMQVRNVADDESVVKASTNSAMIEKQIERLGSDLEDQVKKGELLETRASEAEKSLLELGQKLDRVEKINAEQRKKIEELEQDLQHSKDKLSGVQRQAKLKAQELANVHGMWLPYWFASRSVHCQELASAKWHLHGKPVLDALLEKVAETLAHAQRLVEPHLQATKNKLVPVAKFHFNSLKNSTKPVAARMATAYRACKDAIQPCMVKSQEFADHYWQECRKFSEPHVARIAAASEPHLSAVAAVEPYTRPVKSVWRQLVMATSFYHSQVQKGISGFLEDSELLDQLSAYRLAWWMASAMFALPMLYACKIFSATVRKKNQARADRGGGTSSSRKHARRVEE
ncbi:hypothetical protein CFC21_018671 [Triticum aestivum]|uniref:Uncharacterized protein n=4 Tax=Triticum TaxID=4564 RepID=A0A9R1P3T3_TRITD|nr:uncharacterized protein LOC119351891 [Triticum dicoccoides]XP_044453685.1 uncharacterized protein LOC123185946 [Triticum aestivum]KAF7003346.1 hypothetical protein CFC21_018671 [Triticum aestivum]VAH35937.1 unnamed protein product [Triticum turgidum subsp. durum]